MNKSKKSIANIIRVMCSNFSTIISGVAVGFLLPKVVSLSDYGIYKTFTLYLTYTGLFSIGLVDGIVLAHGGDDYAMLDKPKFRTYYRYLSGILIVFAVLIGLVSFFIRSAELKYVAAMVALDMAAANMANYFKQLSQITQRFREYSNRTLIQSAAKIAITLWMVLLYLIGRPGDYRLYLLLVVAVDYGILFWYLYTYRDLVFGYAASAYDTRSEVARLIRLGFPLLVSNFTTMIIMALDRQFVSILFSTEEYAVYAFAYNMLSLVTVAVSAISTVLYPALKRTDEQDLKEQYGLLVSVISVLVFGMLTVFFPLSWILQWFLPQYTASVPVFTIIFPGLVVSSVISVVINNYYKVFGKSTAFFKISVWILFLSAAANAAAYYLFRSMEAISAASVVTLLIWHLAAEQYFVRHFGYDRKKNLSYLLLMTVLFYGVAFLEQGILGMLGYIVGYGLISWIFGRKTVIPIMRRMFAKEV